MADLFTLKLTILPSMTPHLMERILFMWQSLDLEHLTIAKSRTLTVPECMDNLIPPEPKFVSNVQVNAFTYDSENPSLSVHSAQLKDMSVVIKPQNGIFPCKIIVLIFCVIKTIRRVD